MTALKRLKRCGAELRGRERGLCGRPGSGKYGGRCATHREIARTPEEVERHKKIRMAMAAEDELAFEQRNTERRFLELASDHGLDDLAVRMAHQKMIEARQAHESAASALKELTK